jgi:hypothetical protein
LILPLAGCSTPITATSASSVAESIGHVEPSKTDTCETQKKLAAQSSRIDTIIQGKEVVYKPAPCKQPSPASQPEPKTS